MLKSCDETLIGHVNIGIIFLCIGISQLCLYNTQSKSDLLFNTQSKVLQADRLRMENNEKAALKIKTPYQSEHIPYNRQH